VPPPPTAHTSLGPLPQTPVRAALLAALVGTDHALPFQCMIVPPPTAHTSLDPVPQTPARAFVVPLVEAIHPVPFQWTIVPRSPTAHTSLGPLPQTPLSEFVVPPRAGPVGEPDRIGRSHGALRRALASADHDAAAQTDEIRIVGQVHPRWKRRPLWSVVAPSCALSRRDDGKAEGNPRGAGKMVTSECTRPRLTSGLKRRRGVALSAWP
jgi:hypothetical protein